MWYVTRHICFWRNSLTFSARKAKSKISTYNLLTRNCQTLWIDILFPEIICQCPNQKLLDLPGNVRNDVPEGLLVAAPFIIAASVIVLLRDIGLIPVQVRFCSKSNLWWYVFFEVLKCIIAVGMLWPHISEYHANKKPSTPYLDILATERSPEDEKNGKIIYNANMHMAMEKFKRDQSDPRTVKRLKDFTDELVSLVRITLVLLISSTLVSCLHRLFSYQMFGVLEIALNVTAAVKIFSARGLVSLPGFPSLRHCRARPAEDVVRKEHSD